MKDMEKNGQVGSAKKYKTLINRLLEFSESGELFFIEVTHSYIEQFNRHLLSKGNSHITAGKYLRALRALYNRATIEGLTDQLPNPFLNYRIKKQRLQKLKIK